MALQGTLHDSQFSPIKVRLLGHPMQVPVSDFVPGRAFRGSGKGEAFVAVPERMREKQQDAAPFMCATRGRAGESLVVPLQPQVALSESHHGCAGTHAPFFQTAKSATPRKVRLRRIRREKETRTSMRLATESDWADLARYLHMFAHENVSN